MLNIAEGVGKTSLKERKNFMVVSRGSTLECASLIQFLKNEEEIEENLYAQIIQDLEEISKILYTMISNLEKNIAEK